MYEEAAKKYGTTDIPVNTFNKVWIVPEKAVVYENAKGRDSVCGGKQIKGDVGTGLFASLKEPSATWRSTKNEAMPLTVARNDVKA